LEEHPVPQITDAGLRARALADQATAAALEADWPRAAELNQKLVEASPEDVEARNRLGRALLELGRLDEAKAAFAEVLKIEPYNSIAIRGNSRVTTLQEHKQKPFTTTTKTQPRLFIEDMGKTGILRLINPLLHTSSRNTAPAPSASSASRKACWPSTRATASSSGSSSRRSVGG